MFNQPTRRKEEQRNENQDTNKSETIGFRNKSKYVNNYIKIKWFKHNLKTEIARINKDDNLSICCLQETHFNDIGRLKVKEWEKVTQSKY